MESASFLPKARSWYYTDACIFKQLECIEYISTLSQGLCLVNGFLWKMKLKQTNSVLQNKESGIQRMQLKKWEVYLLYHLI
jgi:hypothetical protein